MSQAAPQLFAVRSGPDELSHEANFLLILTWPSYLSHFTGICGLS